MKLLMQFGIDIDAATKNGIRVARIPGDATGNAAFFSYNQLKKVAIQLARLTLLHITFSKDIVSLAFVTVDGPSVKVDELPLEQVLIILEIIICVVKNMRFDSNVIARAKQMKLIMQFGVGLEGVDIDAATKNGIKVARIPGDATGNAASCAEMAIYLVLGFFRKQNEMQISVKQKTLGEPIGDTLGKTVFILGFGNIGIELTKRLKPFGVKVIATKRRWSSNSEVLTPKSFPSLNGVIDDLIDKKGIHGDIYEFASEADIVVCCLSLNKEQQVFSFPSKK
ncbi:D-isomer specific 2-hydroxyacid dehydrogenase family protein isoform 2 [Hibiscus syriacus]|uniref:D-isomer specific 2-hydroxyacid dehydrogenase family protein isoform 2 n=1 Tax=Hibiscus syriacus TaxID=106335 RepID=A0A6A3D6E4_HIBSY|nr:D-isomer specific 2-hydroxyacid dehydrogenase family protein isoform 2 [Hibiscus syriacus]